ncbi:hypothetical protein CFBP6625_06675 [Agrobacterium tumefaciens]|jgi:hypothetical protein|nr:hypothetical protein CFBP6625_06675 [Agrobacterium tumefaciens]
MTRITRKIGARRLQGKFTPKKAHAFCMKRVRDIELLLQEIASTYNDVDQTVVSECDAMRDDALATLGRTLDEALEEGRTYD